ncbi:MAG: transporter [Lentimicrobium sp.]
MYYQKNTLRNFLFLSAFLILTEFSPAVAQELEPRSYSNIPVGLNFVLAGYAYSGGGVLFDPAVPIENANIKIHGSLLAYARSIKVGQMSGKVDFILPYAWLSGTAGFQGEAVSREISGVADPRIRMTVNFVGAPALPLSGFKNYKQDLVIGASLQVYMPASQYDPERLVNIGTNRFTFKPELGISKTYGRLFFELAGGAAFYTVNNNFYNGKTRSQAPIGSIQGHVVYAFRGGIWAALDGNYYWGGKTTLDGVEGNDLQKNSRFGFTFALPVNIHHSLKFNFSTGVSTRTGSDFNLAGLVWQYRWGKELPKK